MQTMNKLQANAPSKKDKPGIDKIEEQDPNIEQDDTDFDDEEDFNKRQDPPRDREIMKDPPTKREKTPVEMIRFCDADLPAVY